MKTFAGLGARVRAAASSSRRRSAASAFRNVVEPMERRILMDALPAWVAPGSAATWDAATHTLDVTGAATIVADPAADAPRVFVGAGGALSIAPASSTDLDVRLASLSIADGATATVASIGPA